MANAGVYDYRVRCTRCIHNITVRVLFEVRRRGKRAFEVSIPRTVLESQVRSPLSASVSSGS